MIYSSAVNFLESLANLSRGEQTGDYMLQNKKNNPQIYLKRLGYFLNLLNNPHQPQGNYQPKYIHITGTSGKGTVCALMQTILMYAGCKVGAYFSPHPIESYERIRIMETANTTNQNNNETMKQCNKEKYISKTDFARLVENIKHGLDICAALSPFGLPSYFEIFLSLAFLYFKEQKCDYVVLEVGCGGRYDATNIISKSELSIITNIGDDHRQIIGPKLVDIAFEKAGIIKKHGKVLIGHSIQGKIKQVIQREADRQKASLITFDHQILDCYIVKLLNCFNNPHVGANLRVRPDNKIIEQYSNEIIAARAAEILNISTKIIQKALNNFTPLPCRFEIKQIKTSNRGLRTIILDGAHNPDKIKWLYNQIVNWLNQNAKSEKKQKNWLIFGASENKNWTKMLKTILPISHKILLTRHLVSLRKCTEPKKMFDYIKKYQKQNRPQIFLDPADALQLALDESAEGDLIVITGSLFLAGYLRKILGNLT